MSTNAILADETKMKRTTLQTPTANYALLGSPTLPGVQARGVQASVVRTREEDTDRWQAVLNRDCALDGKFVFAVSSTGIFCRPSCPSKRARRENVAFFDNSVQAEGAGYRACLRCRPKAADGNPQSAMVRAVCRFIEQQVGDQQMESSISLKLLAKEFRLSPFHLQRTFKSVLGVSPKAYVDACRLRQVKQNLQTGHSVTTSLYAAGYGSSSRLYERTASQLGMTPEKYRRGAIAAMIRYTITDSPLGRMLIAATDKGVCAITFGDSDELLHQGLVREFPFATRKRDDATMAEWSSSLNRLMQRQDAPASLPLDIRATAFQRRVWEALQQIPRGETRSYSELAREIGSPFATRAVARACATNRIAVAIPCHRVVRQDGGLGGYRWGVRRKEQLLALEHRA